MKILGTIVAIAILSLLTGCALFGPEGKEQDAEGQVLLLSPDGLHKNPTFSQLAVVSGRTRTVYIGGQNAVDSSGNIVGRGDIAVQAEQVARNLLIALDAAGAGVQHIVKWNIYAVKGQPVPPAMMAFQKVLGRQTVPPAICVLFVSSLAHPDFLLEVEAVAVVPEK
jgi:enamine deaminase RidA (YjgF/YER057c/UK114 family)